MIGVDDAAALLLADSTWATGIENDATRLRGTTANPLPPDSATPMPAYFLGLMDEVAAGDPNRTNGILRLWGYDHKHIGYGRIRPQLIRAGQLVAAHVKAQDDADDTAIWIDPATEECIVTLTGGVLSIPSEDAGIGKLQQWMSWMYEKAMLGGWP